jgi:hypothetical protein
MEKPFYWSLGLNQEQNQILLYNVNGPLFAVAKEFDGRWIVDTSEVKQMQIDFMENDLQNGLHELIYQNEITTENITRMQRSIIRKFYPNFPG